MDVRIGVVQSPKELEIDLPDDADTAALMKDIESVVGDDGKLLWLTDRKGRQIGVPSGRIAYVEIGTATDDRRVGFGTR